MRLPEDQSALSFPVGSHIDMADWSLNQNAKVYVKQNVPLAMAEKMAGLMVWKVGDIIVKDWSEKQ